MRLWLSKSDVFWLFGKGRRAGNGELAGLGGGCVSGLCAAYGNEVIAGEDDAVAFGVDLSDGAGAESEGDVRRLAGGEVDPLESGEDADGGVGASRLRKVDLRDFVARPGSTVLDVGLDSDRTARLDLRRQCEVGVVEGGVAEAEAEAVERLAGEVTVGTALHCVIFKCGYLIERGVEGERGDGRRGCYRRREFRRWRCRLLRRGTRLRGRRRRVPAPS